MKTQDDIFSEIIVFWFQVLHFTFHNTTVSEFLLLLQIILWILHTLFNSPGKITYQGQVVRGVMLDESHGRPVGTIAMIGEDKRYVDQAFLCFRVGQGRVVVLIARIF